MEGLPRGINGLFWEERPFADGGSFHYHTALTASGQLPGTGKPAGPLILDMD